MSFSDKSSLLWTSVDDILTSSGIAYFNGNTILKYVAAEHPESEREDLSFEFTMFFDMYPTFAHGDLGNLFHINLSGDG